MQMLSPVDALSPAFRRTREVLGMPFRLGFFLKIAFIAALTQPNFYSILISGPMQGVQLAAVGAMHPGRHGRFPVAENFQGSGANALAGGAAVAFILVAVLVGLAIWVGMSYLFCRLRFTLFDLTLYREGRVRAAWSKYGRQTWRYFGATLLIGLAFMVLLAATAGPLFVHMFKSLAAMGPQAASVNPFPVFAQMLPLFGIFFLIMLVALVVDAVMQDFIVPPMALEDASIEGAFGRFFALFRENPGSFLGYLLLRFVVALGISWVLTLIVFVVLGILALGGVLIGILLYHAMWHNGTGAQAAFIAIVAVLGLGLAALYFVAMAAVYGIVAVFKQTYALYYFGPRYPELGNRLEPPPQDAFVSMPVEPPLPPLSPLQEPPPVW